MFTMKSKREFNLTEAPTNEQEYVQLKGASYCRQCKEYSVVFYRWQESTKEWVQDIEYFPMKKKRKIPWAEFKKLLIPIAVSLSKQ